MHPSERRCLDGTWHGTCISCARLFFWAASQGDSACLSAYGRLPCSASRLILLQCSERSWTLTANDWAGVGRHPPCENALVEQVALGVPSGSSRGVRGGKARPIRGHAGHRSSIPVAMWLAGLTILVPDGGGVINKGRPIGIQWMVQKALSTCRLDQHDAKAGVWPLQQK